MKVLFLIILLLLSGCAANMGDETMTTAAETKASDPVPASAPAETVEFEQPDLLLPLIDPRDEDFVRVKDYIPDILVDLKYSTADNFTGQTIYDFEDVFLRCGTVMKLKSVSEELAELGYSIKIWDGFRPVSAQFRLWEICPDPTYVANPNVGFSNHSRGFAVDLTLVDAEGREVEMPTEFDDFSALADRDYSDCPQAAADNARILETVMEKHGFSGYWGEWWHFNDTTRYDVESCFDPGVISRQKVQKDTPLLETFADPASERLMIPAGDDITVLGYGEDHVMAEYWGYRGYVSLDAIR